MKRLFTLIAILVLLSFTGGAGAMGVFPTVTPQVQQDTPQQQQAALASAYAYSQAAGDAMKINLANDKSYVTKLNQPTQPIYWPF